MNSIFKIAAVVLMTGFLLPSCTVQKRSHMPGYDVEWSSLIRKPKKYKPVVTNKTQATPQQTKFANDQPALTASTGIDVTFTDPATIPVNTGPDNITGNAFNSQTQTITLECDTIVLKNGQMIAAKVIEIGTSEVKYKNCDNPDGPMISLHKWDVQSIRYPNGTSTILSDNNSAPAQMPRPVTKQLDPISMVAFGLGALGFIFSIFFIFPFLMGTTGLIMGIIGLAKVSKNPEKWSGKGFAIAGIVLGILAIVIFWLWIVLLLSLFGGGWWLWE